MDNRLQAMITGNHIPHALVIDGGTYEERTTAANIIASSVLCESGTKKPCGECASCKKIALSCHPDVITILPEEKKKTLSVDIIREIRDDAYLMPNEADRKVYIIAKAETMQDYAQNALLKVLEEPPKNVSFIILCPSRSMLLSTVLSRVTVFTLTDGDKNTLTANREYEDALTFAKSLSQALLKKSEFELLKAASDLEKNYDMLATSLDCFELIIRDALVISSSGTTLIGPSQNESKELADNFSKESLLKIQEAAADIVKAVSIYSNQNLTITRLVSLLYAGGNT